ncbi:DNA repair photolyase-like protein [Caldicellulosiruptor hydrothermalis 108]|uniref:DNA repair photolyase-like protein n=1 Tax=Caldicellulosiruptor hydrothermalis (strain DSM 18901 / VKM B-2411 / 108) TaxID=632292 RepID=E4QB13_CALH1|nr:deoxyribodipyrimidine photo-lyase [Caldicellulosiruptor hydrothermalis]ADQ05991.1 DNA repair photolyase-like protein [Caldicellulosiruptor hydrothermalis 108]
MTSSEKSFLAKNFSHVYVEKAVLSHPVTIKILENLRRSQIVKIDNYKEVFCRARQNYSLQEKSKKLILAKKWGEFLYPGPSICHNFGYSNFFYTSNILNCICSCEYCFLKGMYSSANIVAFVNIEDYFKEIDAVLKNKPLYLSVSYETDLLALEKIVPFSSAWIEYAASKQNLTIEIRTKSTNFQALENLKPQDNVILAWTLSPQEIIEKFEHGTPSLSSRLSAIKKATENGWKVRLCFDPILYIEDWKSIYEKFLRQVFGELNPDKIVDISVGVFRIPKDYLKRMKKVFANEITSFPYEESQNIYTYPKELKEEMINTILLILGNFAPSSKIFVI